MEPLRCYECGHPISDKFGAFLYMREILLAEQSKKSESTSDKRFIDPDLNQNLTPIFRALFIESICTRKIFTTSKNIHDF